MKIIKRNEGFECEHCGVNVTGVHNGASRNHCPFCLYSKHVDIIPGDRQALCNGLMKPVGVKKYRSTWKIVHYCVKCGKTQNNIVAQDDSMEVIISVSGEVLT
jgi:hypothetical protein